MARKPTGNPTGRPFVDIDWKTFEGLCHIQCTQSEIASFLKIDEDTLRTRAEDNYGDSYSVIYKRYAEGGRCSLRRQQFKQAEKNASMAIWLGKQYLGQRDILDEARHSPLQDTIDIRHENMMLKNKIAEMEANVNITKTE